MTPELRAALALVREGRLDEANAVRADLSYFESARLGLALAHHVDDRDLALELAALLWYAFEVDAIVASILAHYGHPSLREAAAALVERSTGDAAIDVTSTVQVLTDSPEDPDAWRELISSLVVCGSDIEAVHGVAHALAEGHGDFNLWAILVTTLMTYRRGAALRQAVILARHAFGANPEVRGICALVLFGLGDLEAGENELDAVGSRVATRSLVNVARSLLADVRHFRESS